MRAAVFVASWLPIIFGLLLIVSFVILSPLAIFRRTRPAAAAGFIFSGWLYGLVFWLSSLLIVYFQWGGFIAIIAIFFVGIGPVLLAFGIELFSGRWWALLSLALMLAATLGSYTAGGYLMEENSN